jgi:hypothetical protein
MEGRDLRPCRPDLRRLDARGGPHLTAEPAN